MEIKSGAVENGKVKESGPVFTASLKDKEEIFLFSNY
jgi:hypothetical protein